MVYINKLSQINNLHDVIARFMNAHGVQIILISDHLNLVITKYCFPSKHIILITKLIPITLMIIHHYDSINEEFTFVICYV